MTRLRLSTHKALVWINTYIDSLSFERHDCSKSLEPDRRKRIIATAGLWMLVQSQADGLYEFIVEHRDDILRVKTALSFHDPDPDQLDFFVCRIENYRRLMANSEFSLGRRKSVSLSVQSTTLAEQRNNRTAKSYKRLETSLAKSLYVSNTMVKTENSAVGQVMQLGRRCIKDAASVVKAIAEEENAGGTLSLNLARLWSLRALKEEFDLLLLEKGQSLHRMGYSYQLLAVSFNITKQHLFDLLRGFKPRIRWLGFDSDYIYSKHFGF